MRRKKKSGKLAYMKNFKLIDTDGDKIPDLVDCDPFDSKKHGFLGDAFRWVKNVISPTPPPVTKQIQEVPPQYLPPPKPTQIPAPSQPKPPSFWSSPPTTRTEAGFSGGGGISGGESGGSGGASAVAPAPSPSPTPAPHPIPSVPGGAGSIWDARSNAERWERESKGEAILTTQKGRWFRATDVPESAVGYPQSGGTLVDGRYMPVFVGGTLTGFWDFYKGKSIPREEYPGYYSREMLPSSESTVRMMSPQEEFFSPAAPASPAGFNAMVRQAWGMSSVNIPPSKQPVLRTEIARESEFDFGTSQIFYFDPMTGYRRQATQPEKSYFESAVGAAPATGLVSSYISGYRSWLDESNIKLRQQITYPLGSFITKYTGLALPSMAGGVSTFITGVAYPKLPEKSERLAYETALSGMRWIKERPASAVLTFGAGYGLGYLGGAMKPAVGTALSKTQVAVKWGGRILGTGLFTYGAVSTGMQVAAAPSPKEKGMILGKAITETALFGAGYGLGKVYGYKEFHSPMPGDVYRQRLAARAPAETSPDAFDVIKNYEKTTGIDTGIETNFYKNIAKMRSERYAAGGGQGFITSPEKILTRATSYTGTKEEKMFISRILEGRPDLFTSRKQAIASIYDVSKGERTIRSFLPSEYKGYGGSLLDIQKTTKLPKLEYSPFIGEGETKIYTASIRMGTKQGLTGYTLSYQRGASGRILTSTSRLAPIEMYKSYGRIDTFSAGRTSTKRAGGLLYTLYNPSIQQPTTYFRIGKSKVTPLGGNIFGRQSFFENRAFGTGTKRVSFEEMTNTFGRQMPEKEIARLWKTGSPTERGMILERFFVDKTRSGKFVIKTLGREQYPFKSIDVRAAGKYTPITRQQITFSGRRGYVPKYGFELETLGAGGRRTGAYSASELKQIQVLISQQAPVISPRISQAKFSAPKTTPVSAADYSRFALTGGKYDVSFYTGTGMYERGTGGAGGKELRAYSGLEIRRESSFFKYPQNVFFGSDNRITPSGRSFQLAIVSKFQSNVPVVFERFVETPRQRLPSRQIVRQMAAENQITELIPWRGRVGGREDFFSGISGYGRGRLGTERGFGFPPFGTPKLMPEGVSRGKPPKRTFYYQPSLAAISLGIKGMGIPIASITGIATRYIPTSKRRRRKR